MKAEKPSIDIKKSKVLKNNQKSKKSVITQGNEKKRLKGLKKVDSRDFLKKLNKEYELTRLKKITKEQREASISKIYAECKTKFVKLCYKRSSAKIIQCLIKYADDTTLNLIFEEIKNDITNILTKPFGKNVIEKLYLKNKHYKKLIFEIIKKDVKKIVTDRLGIEFLDDFRSCLHEKEIKELIWNLYGNETMLLISEDNNENSYIPLEKINLDFISRKIVNKGIVNYEIAHEIIYLHFCSSKARKENYNEILETLVECVPDFLFTEKGILIASEIIDYNKNKQEEILKSMQPYLLKIFGDEWGVLFILEIMDKFEIGLIKQKIINIAEKQFEDIFINENSVKLLVEILENDKKYDFKISKEMETFVADNFTDFIRNYNYPILFEFSKKISSFLDRSIKFLNEYKDESILKNEFTKEYYSKLEKNNLINLKEILGDKYDKIMD